jgi:molybdate transport system regulatory protein
MIRLTAVSFGWNWGKDNRFKLGWNRKKLIVREGNMGAIRLKSRHWIVDEKDKIIIGEGRMKIFENIERTGSINKTAKSMKMSYKGVWSKIRATESAAKMRIVETQKRGSCLTPEGKKLLEQYRNLKARCESEDDHTFKQIFKEE